MEGVERKGYRQGRVHSKLSEEEEREKKGTKRGPDIPFLGLKGEKKNKRLCVLKYWIQHPY